MPDPVWTASYSLSNTPEQNGFTRTLYGTTAVVTATTTGPGAGRKLVVTETDFNSGAAFITSNVPSLDASVGATAQATVAVSGTGDAGFELTFLNHAFGLNVAQDGIILDIAADNPDLSTEITVSTASNVTATIFRATVDGSSNLNIYRGTTLIAGPLVLPICVKPFQRVLFWGESGGTQTFTGLQYYIGGAVAPG